MGTAFLWFALILFIASISMGVYSYFTASGGYANYGGIFLTLGLFAASILTLAIGLIIKAVN